MKGAIQIKDNETTAEKLTEMLNIFELKPNRLLSFKKVIKKKILMKFILLMTKAKFIKTRLKKLKK